MRVLVTGANGFVGGGVLRALVGRPDVRAVAGVRDAGVFVSAASCEHCVLGDLAYAQFSASQFTGIDVLVHTAARVHVMRETDVDPLQAFRQANVQGLQALATAAAAGGVRRFVFVSSIKVNGEETPPGVPYTADDVPAPVDPYGVSKHEAEQALRRICEDTGMEWVIVRPPLVYGPEVKANFLRLMQSLESGMPLPVGSLQNRRSLVALDNLVDLLVTCLSHPQAANQTFLVSDGGDLSVAELTALLSRLLSSRSWLFPFPAVLLRTALAVIGRVAVAQRLCGELRVDIEKTRTSLGWQPPVSVEQGLSCTVAHYLERAR